MDAWCHALPHGAVGRLGSEGGAVGDHFAVAPGGERWATASSLSDVCVWTSATGLVERCLPEIPARTDGSRYVVAIGFTSGGDRLAIVTQDEFFSVDVARGALLHRAMLAESSEIVSSYSYSESAFRTTSLAVSPRGDRVAVGVCSERTAGVVRVLDADGKRVATYEMPPSETSKEVCGDAVAFSSDGKVVAASRRNLVLVWDRKGDVVGQVDTGDASIDAIAFTPDDRGIALSGYAGAVNVVSTTTWNVTQSFGYVRGSSSGANRVAFSPGGKWFAAEHGGTTRVFGVESGALELSVEEARLPVFASDDQLLVMNHRGVRMVSRMKLPSGERLAPFDLSRHEGDVRAVALRADGKVAATVASDGVRTWEVPSGKPMRYFPAPERVSLSDVAFLRDGSLVVVTGDALLHRIGAEAESDRAPAPLANVGQADARSDVVGIASSPASDVVAITLADGTLRRWDATTSTELPPVQLLDVSGWDRPPTAPAWSSDGATIAVGVGGEVWLVDAASGAVRQRVALLEGETVHGIDLAPSRAELAILGDRRVVLVDVAGAPTLVATIERTERLGQGTIRYAAGGARVAIADNALHVLDIPTGRWLTRHGLESARADELAVVGTVAAVPQLDGTTLLFDLGGAK